MVFFEEIEQAPTDPILGIAQAFAADPREQKINLGIGVYRTEELQPLVLETVREAEKILLEKALYKEYLPIDGEKSYLEGVYDLVFGASFLRERAVALQTIGGTGGLRIGAEFLKKSSVQTIYLPDPTWDNHRRIFTHAGLKVATLPYYNKEKRSFDFAAMIDSISQISPQSAVLLQGCCHNPTGFDPTIEEWEEIAAVLKKRSLLPFFDLAYQGFGKGIDEDARAIRLFADKEMECLVASSYSKNFGLYAERTGALFILCNSSQEAQRVASQAKVIIRGIWSNPPCHGARIVATILSEKNLRSRWEEEVKKMRNRIQSMRGALVDALSKRGRGDFSFINEQMGMFSYTGLRQKSVERLTAEHAIYLPLDGRINIAGLNNANLPIVADAIVAVD